MLCESRGENKSLKKDLAELRQLYHDAQEDIQLLHDTLAKQKNCNNRIYAGADGMDPRQDLVSQLEKSQEKVRKYQYIKCIHVHVGCSLLDRPSYKKLEKWPKNLPEFLQKSSKNVR